MAEILYKTFYPDLPERAAPACDATARATAGGPTRAHRENLDSGYITLPGRPAVSNVDT